ncbi:MAG: hypothetical protein KGS61_08390 [Verrucomicrobia bacterium]|nr:hypothetical protein [Verrucomicrobiota bacterium]
MIDWNIQSRSAACQACNRPFADRQPFHTLLFDQKSAYQRLDVCEPCWTAQFSQGASDRKGFVSHWQSEFAAPPPAPPEPIQKETAETLLRKLVALNDPNYAAAGYVLAVMLERKRVFKAKGQIQPDNRRHLIYEHARTGEVFTVPDPELRLSQLDAVQRDVARLLEHGLNPPLAAVPPPGAATDIGTKPTPAAPEDSGPSSPTTPAPDAPPSLQPPAG